MSQSNLEILTVANCKKAKHIISTTNPEWGEKIFNYDPTSDKFHSFGVGPNSALLFEHEFRYWSIVDYK